MQIFRHIARIFRVFWIWIPSSSAAQQKLQTALLSIRKIRVIRGSSPAEFSRTSVFGVNAQVPSESPSGIALFDLDGTLLAWDTQLLFRHHVIRSEPWRALFLPLYLASLACFPILKLGGLKRSFLSYLWRMPAPALAAHARAFAASIVPTVYPELREALENHRRQGHFLILSSASPEFYVAEIGRALGFHLALGTELPSSSSCPLFPKLVNHKGTTKVERLLRLLPPSYFSGGLLSRSHGYTDSRADLPMLALCHSASVVNPDAALTALARAAGWQILRPSRPWRNRADFWWRSLALLTGIGRLPAAYPPVPARGE